MPKNGKKQKNKKSTKIIEERSEQLTKWIGSSQSLVFHTIFFAIMMILAVSGINSDRIFLVLTTIVSLEAIYLSIFIQMTVNRNTQDLMEVSKDIEEIQEDVEEISEDVEEIQKDVEEIQVDVDEIQKDVDEIQEDVEEIEKDVDEIEKEEAEDKREQEKEHEMLGRIENTLSDLMKEIETLKKK